MITENYISLETARLLKDKGFRCVTNRYYNAQYDEIRTVSDTFMMDWNDEAYMKKLGMEGAIAIPTLTTNDYEVATRSTRHPSIYYSV